MSLSVRPIRPLPPIARASRPAAPAPACADAPAPARPVARKNLQPSDLGKRIFGGVTGGALGLIGGSMLGWAAASLVGPSAALGLGIVTIVSALGTVAGAKAGAHFVSK